MKCDVTQYFVIEFMCLIRLILALNTRQSTTTRLVDAGTKISFINKPYFTPAPGESTN